MLRRLFTATLLLALALPAMAFASVNINKASASEIAEGLSGIGQSKAQAIVAYRGEHGSFKSLEELTQVKGIGQATVDRNRDNIEFAGTAAPAKAAKAKAKSKAKHSKKASSVDAE